MKNYSKKYYSDLFIDQRSSIFKYIFYKVNDKGVADDLTQDTFLRTWQYLKAQQKAVINPQAFLYTVAKNLVIDYYKTKKQRAISLEQAKTMEIAVYPDFDNVIDNKFLYHKVLGLIKDSENKYQNILWQRFIKELSINEISQSTGKSPNYVSVLIYQGISRIKEKIN